MKNLGLHNVDILQKFLKDYSLNKKYIAEKDNNKKSNKHARKKSPGVFQWDIEKQVYYT